MLRSGSAACAASCQVCSKVLPILGSGAQWRHSSVQQALVAGLANNHTHCRQLGASTSQVVG